MEQKTMKEFTPPVTIEKAFIEFSGDNSVGIASASYEMTLYREVSSREELEEVRKLIKDLYENIDGEFPNHVMFDFELKAIQDNEASMEEDEARYRREEELMDKRYRDGLVPETPLGELIEGGSDID